MKNLTKEQNTKFIQELDMHKLTLEVKHNSVLTDEQELIEHIERIVKIIQNKDPIIHKHWDVYMHIRIMQLVDKGIKNVYDNNKTLGC